MIKLLIALLLIPTITFAAAPTRQSNYVSQTTIRAADVSSNENVIFSYLQAGVDTYANDSIVNADINASAAIAYSKLNLSGSIVNADISSSAAIVGSKLDLSSPGAIGGTSANTGAFSSLSSSTITTTGNIGIGTPAPTTGRLIIAGGNVGIGTLNANQALTVAGKVYSTSGGIMFPDNTTQTTAYSTDVNSSNVIFEYHGVDDSSTNANTGHGEYTGISAAAGIASVVNRYLVARGQASSFHTVITSKWKKVAGVSTLTFIGKIFQSLASDNMLLKVDVGGANGTATTAASTTPTFCSATTIDVSGLSNGTTYDITIQLATSNNGANPEIYLSELMIFGS